MNIQPVLFVVGILLTTLGVAMVVPAAVDLIVQDFDWQAFLVSSCITVFVGVNLILSCRPQHALELTLRQTFLLTAVSWIALAAFAALPFMFSNLPMGVADAYFESMSGLTTTGSTVLAGLDFAPTGILLWRGILQWIGGVGIIVMAVAVLPYLRVGGMQLFRTESSDQTEKILPRVSQITAGILAVYTALCSLCAILLVIAGMTPFEAVTHSMATVSTGGFSTSDGSIGHFNSLAIEAILVVFMLAGSLTFTLYLRALHGDPRVLWRNSQVRWFIGIVAAAAASLSIWLVMVEDIAPFTAVRQSVFSVVSIITTTGFTTTDYGQWGGFAAILFYFITFIGGCAGSTAGGLKVFRVQVLYTLAVTQLRRTLFPHGVFQPVYEGRPLTEAFGLSVLGFFFLYGVSFAAVSTLLALTGLDLVTSLSGAATAIANVGPGLGQIIGPAGNFASLSDPAKWVLSAGMLLGRLELVTLIVLFQPSFWRG